MSAKRISFPFFVLFCPFSLFIELHLVRLVRFPFCFSQLKRILDSNFSINNSNVCNAKVSLDFSWATNKSQVLGNKQISNEREDEIEKGHRFHGIKSVNSAKVSLFHPFCVCMSAWKRSRWPFSSAFAHTVLYRINAALCNAILLAECKLLSQRNVARYYIYMCVYCIIPPEYTFSTRGKTAALLISSRGPWRV